MLTIDLSTDMEQRLEEEAARHGQPPAEYARAILEATLATPPKLRVLPDGLPPDAPEQLTALAAQQGVGPGDDPSRLLGDWSDVTAEDDTDVDAFLAAREQWKWDASPN